MEPQLVVQDTERRCCVCGSPLEQGEYAFWQRLEVGEARRWHRGACDEHMRGMTSHESCDEEDAELDAGEAADIAEDRHLRSLEGE